MTLNLPQVIRFGRNRKPVYYLIRAVTAVYSNFSSIFNRLGDIGGLTCTETEYVLTELAILCTLDIQ